MEQVCERFHSPGGGGKEELRAALPAELSRGRWVRVFVSDVQLHSTAAGTLELRGTFVMGRSKAFNLEDLARESTLGGERIQGVLEQEADGAWRFVTASHRAVSSEELLRIPD